jgi:hypothetical protein
MSKKTFSTPVPKLTKDGKTKITRVGFVSKGNKVLQIVFFDPEGNVDSTTRVSIWLTELDAILQGRRSWGFINKLEKADGNVLTAA